MIGHAWGKHGIDDLEIHCMVCCVYSRKSDNSDDLVEGQ